MKKQEENNVESRQQPTKIEVVKDEKLTALCYLAFFFFLLLFSLEFLGKNFLWLYLGFAFFLGFTARFVR
ncbi:MAG: hypothetical protein IJX18_01585, partial [Clostridia bacterium]|nr:hypothetical protein [Clostridia bacterium]